MRKPKRSTTGLSVAKATNYQLYAELMRRGAVVVMFVADDVPEYVPESEREAVLGAASRELENWLCEQGNEVLSAQARADFPAEYRKYIESECL